MTEELQKAIVDRLITKLTSNSNRLDLSDLGLTQQNLKDSIPTITGVGNLKELDLSGNPEIKQLPHEIGILTSLEKLNLSNTGLMTLPDSIPGVKELPNGRVAFMQRWEVSPTENIAQNSERVGMKELKELNLSQNRFIILPIYFPALHNLEKLDLSDTNQTEIPLEATQLPLLQELVYKNNYESINEERHNQLRNKGVSIITHDMIAPENRVSNNAATAATLENQETTAQSPSNNLAARASVSNLAAIGGAALNQEEQQPTRSRLRLRSSGSEEKKKPAKRQRKT